jgi:hypothetical protein
MYSRPFAATLLAACLIVSRPLSADEGAVSPQTFSTVRIFFLNEFFPDPIPSAGDLSSASGGGGAGGFQPANLRFEIVRFYLNEKFVGNAMLRLADVKPTFHLPPGEHLFRIECDGYRPFEVEMNVLQHGSTQWLVVMLERAAASKDTQDGHAAEPDPAEVRRGR